jgi:hypothetical protein
MGRACGNARKKSPNDEIGEATISILMCGIDESAAAFFSDRQVFAMTQPNSHPFPTAAERKNPQYPQLACPAVLACLAVLGSPSRLPIFSKCAADLPSREVNRTCSLCFF